MLAFVDPPGSTVLPLASVARSSSPADFKDLPYSPTLLLSVPFDAALTADAEYQESCEWGFNSYFAEMSHWTSDLSRCTFIDRHYSSAHVRQYLLREVGYDPVCNPGRLASRAGWGLGWLSALALTDQPLALCGLELLQELVLHDEGDSEECESDESDD